MASYNVTISHLHPSLTSIVNMAQVLAMNSIQNQVAVQNLSCSIEQIQFDRKKAIPFPRMGWRGLLLFTVLFQTLFTVVPYFTEYSVHTSIVPSSFYNFTWLPCFWIRLVNATFQVLCACNISASFSVKKVCTILTKIE